ncbi:sigma-70 family RNA polymerase sigma factor [Zavarzinia compransoris]|uniref:RNA polymerase subunit sigma n=1 Tax=Zavarzinia compransoris TaxID=1264899 RepID=A0A317DVS7_9PROT|nr:sigma-70 family RNA polymerase sigma factor [Zavarzinia compransoris]PWR18070.1 RNA polymerase subunit sigma [Zavarzinia compransoris]
MTRDLSKLQVKGEIGPMRRYARTLTRDEAAADDLVQETLLRAIERYETFQPGGSLRGWLLSILHNCFIDGRRREISEARRAAEAPREEIAAPAQEHAVRLGQVAQAFLGLQADQRAALHLVTIEGLAYAEAAQVLDIPIGTLMSRLGRARAALRAIENGNPRALRLVGGTDDRNR